MADDFHHGVRVDGAARQIDFSLALKRIDDNLRHLMGDLNLSKYLP